MNGNSGVCTIHYFRYFLDVNFKYHTEVCNVYYDLMIKDLNFRFKF